MTENGFVDFNHGRIYYEVDGEGPALSLIHAGVANLREWDEQIARDSRAGKLDALIEEARQDFEAGRCRKVSTSGLL